MNADQEQAIYGAYLGICVLQSMCRAAGLNTAADRAGEVLKELSIAFPTIYERILTLPLRSAPTTVQLSPFTAEEQVHLDDIQRRVGEVDRSQVVGGPKPKARRYR